jgi:hypothetical protein
LCLRLGHDKTTSYDLLLHKVMPSKLLVFCFSATEGINNSPHPHLEGALALLFQSSMVVTHPRIMLSKVSAVAMDINFFNRDTVRQPLTVTCDHQWGAIKVGSRHGLLPMAWVRECPGVILLTLIADRRNTFFLVSLTMLSQFAGGTGVHSFTTGGLPSSLPRKDYGSIV